MNMCVFKRLFLSMVTALSALNAHSEIPGMRGTDHIGITVPDMAQAISFFEEHLSCERFYHMGPFADPEGDWMTHNLNVHPRTTLHRIQLLRCGNGSNIELFEYSAPDQRSQGPKNSDVGGYHVAFYVDDIQAAVAYLKANTIRVLGEPKTVEEGPNAGESWVYFLSPWGLQLELVSYPQGKAYEKQAARKLFSPRTIKN